MAESFTVFVNPSFNASERKSIGNTVINYILNRTRKGLGIGNIPFRSKDGTPQYTKAYQDHKDFSRAGKSSSPINMMLTGDMLASIGVLDFSLAGQIVIGMTSPSSEDKARWMREKGYFFLGLSNEEKNSILSGFDKLTPAQIAAALAATLLASRADEERENEDG